MKLSPTLEAMSMYKKNAESRQAILLRLMRQAAGGIN